MPTFVQEQLKLTDAQKKDLAAMQKDLDAKLDKLLTDEQKKAYKEMKERGPGRRPGGPGWSWRSARAVLVARRRPPRPRRKIEVLNRRADAAPLARFNRRADAAPLARFQRYSHRWGRFSVQQIGNRCRELAGNVRLVQHAGSQHAVRYLSSVIAARE